MGAKGYSLFSVFPQSLFFPLSLYQLNNCNDGKYSTVHSRRNLTSPPGERVGMENAIPFTFQHYCCTIYEEKKQERCVCVCVCVEGGSLGAKGHFIALGKKAAVRNSACGARSEHCCSPGA